LCNAIGFLFVCVLFHLDQAVDSADEHRGTDVADGTTENEEAEAEHQHVTKVEGGLEEP